MPKSVKIIILFLLISCQSEQEKLIGHWHEYKINNPENILNCYRISDSLIIDNALSNNDFNGYRRGPDIKKSEIMSLADGYWNTTSEFKYVDDKLIFNDSIHWKRITDKEQYFIEDFSVGLHINILPVESINGFDLKNNYERPLSYIYIGKIKNGVFEENKHLNKDKFYIQLNDKLSNLEDLGGYTNCGHCDITKQYYMIHADRNTPRDYLNKVEAELLKYGILKKNIYYLNINPNTFDYGYMHSY